MPSSRPVDRLDDIIANCDRILAYVSGMSIDDFLMDDRTKDAVERCLQRISEAAYKLGDYLDERYPDVPWKQARGIGNVLRHKYDEVADGDIWNSIVVDIPVLRRGAQTERDRLTKEGAAGDGSGDVS